jgi:hypothetical protein
VLLRGQGTMESGDFEAMHRQEPKCRTVGAGGRGLHSPGGVSVGTGVLGSAQPRRGFMKHPGSMGALDDTVTEGGSNTSLQHWLWLSPPLPLNWWALLPMSPWPPVPSGARLT